MKSLYLFFLVALVGSPAWGVECDTPSPYEHTPEEYFSALKQKSITKKEYKQIKSLFEKMDDNWEGKGTYVECKRVDGILKKFVSKSTIKSEIDFDSQGVLRLVNEVRSANREKLDIKRLKFHLGKYHFRAGANTKESHVGLVDSKKNEVGFLVRVNATRSSLGSSGGRQITDIYTTYTATKRSLKVKLSVYVNGVFGSETLWKLKPR